MKKGSVKAQRRKNNGYMIVDLYKDNKQKTFHVHRLVAETFIDNLENKETVNHIDGNKQNNRVDNLEWATQAEQNTHFYKNNLKDKENIDKAVLAMNKANSKAVMCVDLGIVFKSIAEAARYININASTSLISKCCKGKRRTAYGYKWTYVA